MQQYENLPHFKLNNILVLTTVSAVTATETAPAESSPVSSAESTAAEPASEASSAKTEPAQGLLYERIHGVFGDRVALSYYYTVFPIDAQSLYTR